ncbi:DUF6766 family protein [Salinibacterium sp. ZJ454]|uniref:DUF6766 family protein n=1 Tax=Salinibacterium sp. ZJ454 TaxID=2708339 RepID=UPI00142362A4|nr:DUF6766 family protein [Salinibacterium sp. ZJ454]
MPRAFRDHGLSIFFGVIFVLALTGQAFTGQALYNAEQLDHSQPAVGLLDYVTSSAYVVDVAENWQSEFLQFLLFILGTVWLVQRGSPESKKPGEEGTESDQEQLVGRYARPDSPRWAKVEGGRRWLLSNSLALVMGSIFLLSWLAQSVAGVVVYNDEQLQHAQPTIGWAEYLLQPEFWNRTLQNWQSEFLAVGCMVAFSIYLRQRGSAESKPVGAPHSQSSISG